MGLLDRVMAASDQGGNFAYLGGTPDGARSVCKVIRMQLRDPATDDKITKAAFNCDVEILHTTLPDVAKGSVLRVNPPATYTDSLMACFRRFTLAAKTSKEGVAATPTLGLEQKDGEKDKEFATRVGAEYGRLVGDAQPLAGSIITVISTRRVGKQKEDGTRGGYTLYEALVPNEQDLRNAGLI